MGTEVFHALKRTLHDRGLGDGGGRRGRLRPRPRLQRGGARGCWSRASRRRATSRASDVAIALDPATSEIYERRRLRARARGPHAERRPSWPTTGPSMADRYPIVSIEDGMDEEDWDGWKALTERLGDHVQLVGDDLFVTNTERLRRGIDIGRRPTRSSIKVNQIGTLTETLDAIAMARDAGYTAVMSHRSGETEDVDDRRPRRRHRLRPDQDRRAVALGPRGQVQPAAADRGGARRRRDVPRAGARSGAEGTLQQDAGAGFLAAGRRAARTKEGTRRWTPPAPWPLGVPRPSAGTGSDGSRCCSCSASSSCSTSTRPINYVKTWQTANAKRDDVNRLQAQNKRLRARKAAMKQPATLEHEARALGMVRPGERGLRDPRSPRAPIGP